MNASQDIERAVHKLKLAIFIADAALEELAQLIDAAASGLNTEALNSLAATIPETPTALAELASKSDSPQPKSRKRDLKPKNSDAPKRPPHARFYFYKKFKLETIAQRKAAGKLALSAPELQALANEEWLKLNEADKAEVLAAHKMELEESHGSKLKTKKPDESPSSSAVKSEPPIKRAKLELKEDTKGKNCVIC